MAVPRESWLTFKAVYSLGEDLDVKVDNVGTTKAIVASRSSIPDVCTIEML